MALKFRKGKKGRCKQFTKNQTTYIYVVTPLTQKKAQGIFKAMQAIALLCMEAAQLVV